MVELLYRCLRKPENALQHALRISLALALGAFLLRGCLLIYQSHRPELLYRKDLVQDYLSARAFLAGKSPYAKLNELRMEYLPGASNTTFEHENPHPLLAIAVFSPLALLGYWGASWVWTALSVAALFAGVFVLSAFSGRRRQAWLSLSVLALTTPPVIETLVVGQITLFLFLGAASMIGYLQRDRLELAGALLGVVLSLKFFAWPFLFFWLLRRRWVPLASALSVFGLIQLLNILWVGLPTLQYYYLEVLPSVSSLYRTSESNISVWTIGQRLFEGMYPLGERSLRVDPLVLVPSLVFPASALAFLALLVWGLRLALRTQRTVSAYSILLLMSIFISPISWDHGLAIALIYPFTAYHLSAGRRMPRLELSVALVVTVLLFWGGLLSTGAPIPSGEQVGSLSFLAALPTMVPMFSLLLAMWSVQRIDSRVYQIDTDEETMKSGDF